MTWHEDMPMEYRNQVVTGDARVLAERIPDESIDLTFTDPVYENVEDYRWLAETAARVLKQDGHCLVFGGNTWLPEYLKVTEPYLKFQQLLILFMSGVTVGRHVGRLFAKTIPCLWLSRGSSQPKHYVWDVSVGVSSRRKHGNHHRWGKDPTTVRRWIEGFSNPDDSVWDPFSGGGTIPAACKVLGRNYVAFEIDPNTAELARNRVLNTQPPLFVPQPEQGTLDLH